MKKLAEWITNKELDKIQYISNIYVNKTCDTCSCNSFLLCPKINVLSSGISNRTVYTCEYWNKGENIC